LTLMNNPFVTQQASLWARHVLAEPGKTQAQRVAAMYETAFGRAPTAPETAEALAFLDAQTTGGGAEANATAWADLAHILFNVKEFVFVN
jgi:hypothetical protein